VCYRQTALADDTCNKTLSDYLKFDNEMSVVSAVWKECKRLIESYNEQQVTITAVTVFLLVPFMCNIVILQEQRQCIFVLECTIVSVGKSHIFPTVSVVEA